MIREEFTRKIKLTAFGRCGGECESCSARLYPGKTHFDHILPAALGGKGDLGNCQVLCEACHTRKSGERDVPQIRKADRQKAAHLNARKRKGRPIPGSKASGWRKPFNKPPERRE